MPVGGLSVEDGAFELITEIVFPALSNVLRVEEGMRVPIVRATKISDRPVVRIMWAGRIRCPQVFARIS